MIAVCLANRTKISRVGSDKKPLVDGLCLHEGKSNLQGEFRYKAKLKNSGKNSILWGQSMRVCGFLFKKSLLRIGIDYVGYIIWGKTVCLIQEALFSES